MKEGETWRIRHLEESDNLESFRCGDPDLDDFLLNDSLLYEKELSKRNRFHFVGYDQDKFHKKQQSCL